MNEKERKEVRINYIGIAINSLLIGIAIGIIYAMEIIS